MLIWLLSATGDRLSRCQRALFSKSCRLWVVLTAAVVEQATRLRAQHGDADFRRNPPPSTSLNP
jgi:hypothetical protein